MNDFFVIAFLFFVGSVAGWILELFFRRFFSPTGAERRWVNPGFCTGPYLPIYGFGLCGMYLITGLAERCRFMDSALGQLAVLLALGGSMTLIEYISGLLCLKVMGVRLWDYSDQWGNVQGLICPLFSAFWTAAGAGYCYLLHPLVLTALDWLSQNPGILFAVGMFYGVFIPDAVSSAGRALPVQTAFFHGWRQSFHGRRRFL